MNGECGRRVRKEGAGRETRDRGGPSMGSPIASELANAITIPCPCPFPHGLPPPTSLGNQPTAWSSPELDRKGREGDRVWAAQESCIKPHPLKS